MGYKDDYEAAKKAGTAERMTPNQVVFKEGDTFVGKFLTRDLIKSTKKDLPDFYRYTFNSDEGPATVLFSQAFDSGPGAELQKGGVYAFEHKGKIQISGNRSFNKIDVFRIGGGSAVPEHVFDTEILEDSD